MKHTTIALAAACLLLAACEKEEQQPPTPAPAPAPLSYSAEVRSDKMPGQQIEVRVNPVSNPDTLPSWNNTSTYYFGMVQMIAGDTLEVRTRLQAVPDPLDTGVVRVRMWRVTVPTATVYVSTSGTEWTTQQLIMP